MTPSALATSVTAAPSGRRFFTSSRWCLEKRRKPPCIRVGPSVATRTTSIQNKTRPTPGRHPVSGHEQVCTGARTYGRGAYHRLLLAGGLLGNALGSLWTRRLTGSKPARPHKSRQALSKQEERCGHRSEQRARAPYYGKVTLAILHGTVGCTQIWQGREGGKRLALPYDFHCQPSRRSAWPANDRMVHQVSAIIAAVEEVAGGAQVVLQQGRKVDIRLPGKGDSNSHGARLVHQKHRWTRTSRLSIKNSLSPQATKGVAEKATGEKKPMVRPPYIPACART